MHSEGEKRGWGGGGGVVTGPGLPGLLWPRGSHWWSVLFLGGLELSTLLLDPSAASCDGGCPHFTDEKAEARGTK